MKLLEKILGIVMLVTAGTAHSSPLCQDYWEARKTGGDWRLQPPLSQFDTQCASNIVVAQDGNGFCGVHVPGSSEYPDPLMIGGTRVAISWFSCIVGDVELAFGDFVDGTVEKVCVTSCDGCAEGSHLDCTHVFHPKRWLQTVNAGAK